MPKRPPNKSRKTLTPEEIATVVLGAAAFFSEVLLPVITFWWHFVFALAFAALAMDLCLRSRRIQGQPLTRIALSVIVFAVIAASLWNPLQRQYMQEHLYPSFPFVFGAPLGENDSTRWVMVVEHFGPEPAYNCDIVFSDTAGIAKESQWMAEHPGVVLAPPEITSRAHKDLPRIPEIDQNSGLGGVSFNWDPIDPDNHHYLTYMACRGGGFTEEWDIERLNGVLRTSLVIKRDSNWENKNPYMNQEVFSCVDPQIHDDSQRITPIAHRSGTFPGWRPNHAQFPVLIISPNNSLWSGASADNGSLGCWDMLSKHFGDARLPLDSLFEDNPLLVVIALYGVLVLILPLYMLFACWLMGVSDLVSSGQ